MVSFGRIGSSRRVGLSAAVFALFISIFGIPDIAHAGQRIWEVPGVSSLNLRSPDRVALDFREGTEPTLVVASSSANRVVRVYLDGSTETIAGTGRQDFDGDEPRVATEASLNRPHGVAVNHAGEVFIADSWNHRIRKVGIDGKISTVAGSREVGYEKGGFCRDGRKATFARLDHPEGVAVIGTGEVFIADTGNHRIRKVGIDGKISTVVGSGPGGGVGDFRGDGWLATHPNARLNAPSDVALSPRGEILIADSNNHRIRKVGVDGTLSTIAGSGPIERLYSPLPSGGFNGDEMINPLTAWFDHPTSVAVNDVGEVFFTDLGSHRIRKVGVDGKLSTVAGSGPGRNGYRPGDDPGVPDSTMQLVHPYGVAAGAGGIFIADRSIHRVGYVGPAKSDSLLDEKLDTAMTAAMVGDYGVVRETARVFQSALLRARWMHSPGALQRDENGNQRELFHPDLPLLPEDILELIRKGAIGDPYRDGMLAWRACIGLHALRQQIGDLGRFFTGDDF